MSGIFNFIGMHSNYEFMMEFIPTSGNVAAFRAQDQMTAEDYINVLVPAVTSLVKRINEINFLLVMDTEIISFASAEWIEDALLGLKNLGKWNRAALVTDCEKAISFTNALTNLVPGEFKGFKKESFEQAMAWVQTGESR